MNEQEIRIIVYDILADVFGKAYSQAPENITAEHSLKDLEDIALKMYFEAKDDYNE